MERTREHLNKASLLCRTSGHGRVVTLAAAPAHRSAWAMSYKILELDLRLKRRNVVPLAPIVLFGFLVAAYYPALEFRRSTNGADGVLRDG